MSITSPFPPATQMGMPTPFQLVQQLMGASRRANEERIVQSLRPALQLIGDLKELLQQNPELSPIVQALLQSEFLSRKPGARAPRDGSAARPPVPPLPFGLPGMALGMPGATPPIMPPVTPFG